MGIGRAAAVQDSERDPVPRRAADAKVEPLVKVRIPVADDLEIGCIPVYRQYPDIARIKAGRNRQRHFAFTSTVSPDRPGKSLNKAAANRLASSPGDVLVSGFPTARPSHTARPSAATGRAPCRASV